MLIFRSSDDLLGKAGQDLGVSGWHEVDQLRIDAFAAVTGDHQWIHVDVEKAGSSPFGSTIAHGYLILSMLPALMSQVFSFENADVALNYGSNKVRFVTPVKAGAFIRAGFRLNQVVDHPRGHMAGMTATVEIRDVNSPALVAENLGIYAFRGGHGDCSAV